MSKKPTQQQNLSSKLKSIRRSLRTLESDIKGMEYEQNLWRVNFECLERMIAGAGR